MTQLISQEDGRLGFRPWNELTVAALILLHMSWVVPWFFLIAGASVSQPEGRVFLTLCLVEASLYLLVRLGILLRLKLRIRQGVFLVGLGLCWLASWLALERASPSATSLRSGSLGTMISDFGSHLPFEALLLVVVLFLGKLAMDMVREWNGPASVFSSMRLAIIMLCVFGVLTGRDADRVAVFSVYLFLGAGMIALVAARMAALERKRGGRQGAFDRRWLLAVTGLTVLLVGLATFVSSLLTGQVNRISAILRNIITAFFTLVSLPFTLLVYLLQPLIDAIQRLTKNAKPFQVAEPALPLVETPLAGEASSKGSAIWPVIGQVLVWVVFLFAVYLLLRRLGSWYISQIQTLQDERQSLIDAGGLWKMLLASLRGQFRRAADSLSGLPRFGRRERLRAAARVRQIYVDLMDLSTDLGAPRPAASTPSEFLPVIQKVFLDTPQDLVTITQAYLRVRYGVLPETIQEIQAVETAWQRVKTYGERLLKQNSSMA